MQLPRPWGVQPMQCLFLAMTLLLCNITRAELAPSSGKCAGLKEHPGKGCITIIIICCGAYDDTGTHLATGPCNLPLPCTIALTQHWHKPHYLLTLHLLWHSREYYTLDHLSRLKQFEAQAPYTEGKCSDYCKDYHVQPCTACTTCHFCR